VSKTRKRAVTKPADEPPGFNRDEAIAFLSQWYGATTAVLVNLYHSTSHLRMLLHRSPELQELIDCKAVDTLLGHLDEATNDYLDFAPKLVKLPAPLPIPQTSLEKPHGS